MNYDFSLITVRARKLARTLNSHLDKSATIIVVDDDESIRKTLSTLLEEKGYIVDTAENGKEAIEKSNTKFYNLALIDVRLPDMEGTQLLTAMMKTTPKMVKIMLTGFPAMQNAIDAVNKGADGYIIKPTNIGDLLDTIKKHLEKQQETKKYSEERVTEFIETRVKELEGHRWENINLNLKKKKPT
jgi:DNA-binding NtrC family response regulator